MTRVTCWGQTPNKHNVIVLVSMLFSRCNQTLKLENKYSTALRYDFIFSEGVLLIHDAKYSIHFSV